MVANNAIRIVRREQSLRSIRQKGLHTRLLYENEWLEVLCTEMETRSFLEQGNLWSFPAVLLVIEGSPVVQNRDYVAMLLPGDSVFLEGSAGYRISNPAPSRSVIWTLLLKKEERQIAGGEP